MEFSHFILNTGSIVPQSYFLFLSYFHSFFFKPNAPDMDRLGRGKRSIIVDLKKPQGIGIVKKLCANADVLLEPYRRGTHLNSWFTITCYKKNQDCRLVVPISNN